MREVHFEQGPIRPPSEAHSLLLRITRNCPWNRCEFCHIYKHEKFSLRTVEEVKRDIDAVYARGKTVSKKTIEDPRPLYKAGLSRIHIGLETGYRK